MKQNELDIKAKTDQESDRHAYMIMAHGQFEQLIRVMKLLDDERNDFFIHIDAKAKDFDPSLLEKVDWQGGIYYADRVDVYWASTSIVQATYNLLKKAANTGKYRYYHLLSGADMQLKTQDEIHDFLRDCDKEFIHMRFEHKHVEAREKYYHIFADDFRGRNILKRYIRLIFIVIQWIFGVDRCKKDSFRMVHGSAWFSITDDFARFVIEKENDVMRRGRWTRFPDERFMQTLVYNSEFRDRLYVPFEVQKGDFADSMRKIDLGRGQPYVWRESDFNELMDSGCFFARKFDPNVDSKIISRIEKELLG